MVVINEGREMNMMTRIKKSRRLVKGHLLLLKNLVVVGSSSTGGSSSSTGGSGSGGSTQNLHASVVRKNTENHVVKSVTFAP